MAATLAQIDAAIFSVLSALQCPDGGIVSDARPFALVARWTGEVQREKGLDPEAGAQYPCAFLAWPGEQNPRGGDLTTLTGDGEDAAASLWTVFVGVEDVRRVDDTVQGAVGVPGALALVDAVIAVLDGLLIDGLLRSNRLYYLGAEPFAVRRGMFYIAAVRFTATRSPQRVVPNDTTVPLTRTDGNVDLVDTYGGADPQNPVDKFRSNTT